MDIKAFEWKASNSEFIRKFPLALGFVFFYYYYYLNANQRQNMHSPQMSEEETWVVHGQI